MKWLNDYKVRLVLAGVVAGIVAGGGIVKADFIFGEPIIVPNLSGSNTDYGPHISRDGLEMYLTYDKVEGVCNNDIWVSRRSTTNDPWPVPTKLEPPVNSSGPESYPCLSADGLELYFSEGYTSTNDCLPNPEGYGNSDLWVSKRSSKDDSWGVPENLGPTVNSADYEDMPCISADGLELYFMYHRPPYNGNIFVTTRPTKDDPWGEPVILNSHVNTGQFEYTPFISPDGLSLFFARGYTSAHIHVCQRATKSDPWGPAKFFTPVNSGTEIWDEGSTHAEFRLSFSQADPTLYFTRGSGVYKSDFDIWQVEVTPVVDFNRDGIVDALDVTIMVDHWHTNEPLCDIAPAPMGDGFVDIQDLTVLAEHLFEQVP